jgi:hypothetical protein
MAWYRTLTNQTLAPRERAFVAAVKGRCGIAAAIPLVRRSDGTIRGLTAPYTTCFGPAALSDADAYALGLALGRSALGRLALDALDASCPISHAFLEGINRSGLVVAHYRHFANWHETIDSFPSFWATRPAQLRETVRRKKRKLEARGARFSVLSEPDERAAAIYSAIYAESGKCAEPHPDFMGALLANLARLGHIRLGLLHLEGTPIAAQIWLLCEGRATIFKLAHRAEFSAYSPGTVLTHWLFSQLLPASRGMQVDFGRGDDDYKSHWLKSRAYRRGIVACNPASLIGLRTIATDILPTWAGAARRRIWAVASHRPFPPSRASSISTAASAPTSRETESIMSS